ncbi:MAG: BatA domain-containing protein [Planctomycetes bacterium]|nr:BatA domain-containing protein [Planctomycetota bacterium]
MQPWMWGLALGVPALAALVPIIIHIINLTRYRKIDWAAMEFLLAAYRRTRRRLQMEHIIMLLLRVMAVVLLALAFFPMGCEQVRDWASKTLGLGGSTFTGNAPLHVVLVFDNSASMAYTQEGQTSFDRAKKYALSVIDGLRPNRDRVSIIRLSDVFVPRGLGGVVATAEDAEKSRKRRVGQLANLDIETARRELAATTVASVDTNMVIALREAQRSIEVTPENDAPGFVLVSDFASAGWREMMKDGPSNGDFVELMKKMADRMAGAGTRPVLYDAGFDDASNVAITNITCNDRIVGDGMQSSLFVDVTNFARPGSGENIRNVNLSCRIDQGPERRFGQPLNLNAGQSSTKNEVVLKASELQLKPHEKKTGASRHIEISIIEPDGLKTDNSRSFVLHIVPDVPILMVNGVPSTDPRKDETLYLDMALSISDNKIEGEARDPNKTLTRVTPNRVDTINPNQLTAKDNFLDYRLVILANVSQIPESAVGKLEEFVRAGYSLVIFDGDRVDHQRYNVDLYKAGKGLMPVKLGAPEGSNDVGAKLYTLTPREDKHPILSIFMGRPEDKAALTDPEVIRNWRGVELPVGSEIDPLNPVRVILGVNNGPEARPFMMEHNFGRGRVIYVASTASERWNEMWTGPLPIYLYHEVVNYLTNSEARYSNLGVGETYRRVLRARDVAPSYAVKDPLGTSQELPATADEGLSILEFAGTASAGVYTLQAVERGETGTQNVKWQERFSVSIEPRESDIVKIKGEEGQGAKEAVQGALGENIQIVFQKAGGDAETGGSLNSDRKRGLWLWLAVAGAIFLLAESLWSAVISKPEQ